MATVRELTIRQRRRGLEFADRIAGLALEAPDDRTKQIIYSARNAIQKLYGFTREQKKAELVRLIDLGAANITDLIQESGFSKNDVYELTRELATEKRIREAVMMSIGGNGVGRPTVCYFSIEK
jgi:lipase chaperone LimK